MPHLFLIEDHLCLFFISLIPFEFTETSSIGVDSKVFIMTFAVVPKIILNLLFSSISISKILKPMTIQLNYLMRYP